jgi:predicted metallo-beta-lactamase superfamily hydrolase
MRVVPLAAESLGVRSVATYVECGSTRIIIDPGAALAPSRFNLPPSDEEWEALKRANDRISAYAARADLVFISHYHEDHFRYDPGIYEGRTVWAKDPARLINPRQQSRAGVLWRAVRAGCRLDAAEGRRLETLEVALSASPALSHGIEGNGLGYVVGLSVTDRREGFRFIHASDVQGPLSPVATAYLIRERPHLLYLSGPPSYLEGQVGAGLIEQGMDNLLRIIESTGCRVIMDHHAARDHRFRERFRRVLDTGHVVTAAGFLGREDVMLEAERRDRWARRRKPPARMTGRAEVPPLRDGRASDRMAARSASWRRGKEPGKSDPRGGRRA